MSKADEMDKELEEAIKNLKQQLENTKIANECGLTTKGEFKEDIKAIETVLNYIENSIPKEKVEEQLQELKNMKVDGEVFTTSVNFVIKILQELLEKK